MQLSERHQAVFNAILQVIVSGKGEHEDYYVNNGPSKKEQEGDITGVSLTGPAVVQMNVQLLEQWLEDTWEDADHQIWALPGDLRSAFMAHGYEDLAEAWQELPRIARRKLWEASDFHYGIYGYDEPDDVFYWGNQAQQSTSLTIGPDDSDASFVVDVAAELEKPTSPDGILTLQMTERQHEILLRCVGLCENEGYLSKDDHAGSISALAGLLGNAKATTTVAAIQYTIDQNCPSDPYLLELAISAEPTKEQLEEALRQEWSKIWDADRDPEFPVPKPALSGLKIDWTSYGDVLIEDEEQNVILIVGLPECLHTFLGLPQIGVRR